MQMTTTRGPKVLVSLLPVCLKLRPRVSYLFEQSEQSELLGIIQVNIGSKRWAGGRVGVVGGGWWVVMLADSKDVISRHRDIAGHLMMTTTMSLCAAAHSGVLISEDRCHIRATQ